MDLKRIRDARRREKLSQVALGEIAGVSGAQISRFEHSLRRPRLDEAIKIAERLKLDISDIISPEDAQATLQMPMPPVRRDRNLRTTIPLAEGAAVVEYPATLSPRSRKALKTWLELMAQLVETE